MLVQATIMLLALNLAMIVAGFLPVAIDLPLYLAAEPITAVVAALYARELMNRADPDHTWSILGLLTVTLALQQTATTALWLMDPVPLLEFDTALLLTIVVTLLWWSENASWIVPLILTVGTLVVARIVLIRYGSMAARWATEGWRGLRQHYRQQPTDGLVGLWVGFLVVTALASVPFFIPVRGALDQAIRLTMAGYIGLVLITFLIPIGIELYYRLVRRVVALGDSCCEYLESLLERERRKELE